MGTSDGYVSGLVKIHDSGSPADRFNLVIVAEGYQVGEIAQFQTDVDDFLANFFATAPFNEDAVACAMNIYRLEVVSNDSGADNPVCDDGGGDDTTVDTYFDATFCSDGEIQRLMSGDSALAQSTVEDYLPEWTQIFVLVNDSRRGGAGGSIAWATTGGADWKDVIIHELGHAAFGLADEYDCYACDGVEDDRDNHPGPEPIEPNVTIEPDPTQVKWSSLVTAGGDVPTMPNPDCSQPNNNTNPVGADIVGTFEGAHYYHCGAYRPQYDCMMRDSGIPFCAVCEQEIRDILAAYAVPATTGAITLDTLSVSFDDIPEGTSTVRPVVFNVDTCVPVTFEVSSPPAAPFSVAYEPVVVSNPDAGVVRLARVWIRFDCQASSGSDNDSVTIRLVETGETWDVPLSANCVPRETAAVQLVFDQSGSMLDMTAEGRQKKDVLKDSARVLADVAYTDTGLGANTYDHDAYPLLEIGDAGALEGGQGREDLRDAINTYEPNPAGFTATGDGIEFAKNKLDLAVGYDNHAMIVLTDGKDTASKSVGEVADGVITETVFAIGMGTAEQINPQTLQTLAGATGGFMLMTGLLTEDDTFLLEKFYLQILAGITNNDIILDPEGHLSLANREARIPFDVSESDIEISVITLATYTEVIAMALEGPDGTVIQVGQAVANPSIEYAASADSIIMRAALPLVENANALRDGRWHLRLKLDEKAFVKLIRRLVKQCGSYDDTTNARRDCLRQIEILRNHGVKYSAIVQTYSNLRMRATLEQDSFEPGAKLMASTTLTEYGGPFRGSANVAADITYPDDSVHTVSLTHRGEGRYSTEITAAHSGLYTWRFRVGGTTNRGRPFTREQLRTASVWIGGDRPEDKPQGGGTDPGGPGGIIDLLCCLARHDGLDDKFFKRLAGAGINPDVLKRCLEEFCAHRDHPKRAALLPKFTTHQMQLLRSRLEKVMTDISKN